MPVFLAWTLRRPYFFPLCTQCAPLLPSEKLTPLEISSNGCDGGDYNQSEPTHLLPRTSPSAPLDSLPFTSFIFPPLHPRHSSFIPLTLSLLIYSALLLLLLYLLLLLHLLLSLRSGCLSDSGSLCACM